MKVTKIATFAPSSASRARDNYNVQVWNRTLDIVKNSSKIAV